VVESERLSITEHFSYT